MTRLRRIASRIWRWVVTDEPLCSDCESRFTDCGSCGRVGNAI